MEEVTWVWNLSIFNKLGNGEVKKQETGTESRETKNRDTQFLSNIHWKTKNEIRNNTSDGGCSILVGEEKFSEEGFGD